MIQPKIGVSIGSPNEGNAKDVLDAISNEHFHKRCRFLIIGPQRLFVPPNNSLASDIKFRILQSVNFQWTEGDDIIIIDRNRNYPRIQENLDKYSGEITISSLDTGLTLGVQRKIDGLVIGPLSFDSLALAGFHYSSLVQILKEWTRVENIIEVKTGPFIYFKNLPFTLISLDSKNIGVNKTNNLFPDLIRYTLKLIKGECEEHHKKM